MNDSFSEIIQRRVLLADGAMGTELYSRGFFVNRCYDELNLTNSDTVLEIHEQYANAGADILTTNTYGGNQIQLASFGLEEKTEDINRKGVELAKSIAKEKLYVAGSIGPIPGFPDLEEDDDAIRASFREQAGYLIEAGVDLLLLETFRSLEQLNLAYAGSTEAVELYCIGKNKIPIIPSVSLELFSGEHPISHARAVKTIRSWGSTFLGLNCGGGPPEMLDEMPIVIGEMEKDMILSIMPNAGLPKIIEGRTLYMASPEYMAEYTRRFVQKGAKIVGGCCGTTPEMIKEMCSFLRSVQPGRSIKIQSASLEEEAETIEPVPLKERSGFGKILGEKFAVSVELNLPKGVNTEKTVTGAKFLYENGIDAVNIADGPRASGRMSPTALALLVKREVPIEAIIHVCARDRNLLALQMDLISANALDLHNMMLITGDPPKMGMYPDATAVFDLDAIGLVRCADLLNRGLDFAHRPLKGQTSFVIGVGCNPGAPDLDLEVQRYEEKIKAGAEYVFSQPIYDSELLQTFLKRITSIKPIPFFVGILPLASHKNAEFLHNEVPGMQVPDEIRERMRLAPTKEAQQEEGIKIAAEALKEAASHPLVKGAYIFPPFGRYSSILDVLEMAGIR